MQIAKSVPTAPSNVLLPGGAVNQQQPAQLLGPSKAQSKSGAQSTDFSDAMTTAGAVASMMSPVGQQQIPPMVTQAGIEVSPQAAAQLRKNSLAGGDAQAILEKNMPMSVGDPLQSTASQKIQTQGVAIQAQPQIQVQPQAQIQAQATQNIPASPRSAAAILGAPVTKNGLSSGIKGEESWEIISSDPGKRGLDQTGEATAPRAAQPWSSEDYLQTVHSAKKPVSGVGKKSSTAVNPGVTNGLGGQSSVAEGVTSAKASALPASVDSLSSIRQGESGGQTFNTQQTGNRLDSQNAQQMAAQMAAGATAGRALGSLSGGAGSIQKGTAEMTGNVVPGSLSKARLSSDSVMGMSNHIRSFEQQGGGEIRVKLNPDNLGELSVRVVARGGQVGLEIRASDENAKKVIEESIDALKESLSTQNLNLARLDVAVGQAHASGDSGSQGAGQDLNQNQNSSQANQQNFLNDQNPRGNWQDREGRDPSQMGQSLRDGERMRVSAQASPLTTRYQRQMTSDGRLNVLA